MEIEDDPDTHAVRLEAGSGSAHEGLAINANGGGSEYGITLGYSLSSGASLGRLGGFAQALFGARWGRGAAALPSWARMSTPTLKSLSAGVEVRFSSEDSFRSDLIDILTLYKAADKAGVNRVGVADTVGGATPRMVYDLVRTLRETHFHDDTGCAIANALSALEAGATHIDTSVLGIGERNGFTPLGGLMARMVVTAPEYVTKKYNLKALKSLEELVADAVQINIPFNNPITGFCAFTHKAGIHAKAILANPSTYEIIDPEIFGLTRYVSINSRITGWNAVKSRVEQLGLKMTNEQVKEVTAKIKQIADIRPLAIDDPDSIIRSYHLDLQ
ncbi:hypothetical protein F4823DRAFT_637839 [Ustulina deusta]|nr:hypothetical protein F4823DRAFT_637839 [Ustulina deusta]